MAFDVLYFIDDRLNPQVEPGFSMYDLVREEDNGKVYLALRNSLGLHVFTIMFDHKASFKFQSGSIFKL